MSFLTAILGGLGGYAAGRNQRQQTNLAQQQYNEQEADRRRALTMDEAKYRDAAQQILANKGTDPATAQWDPQKMQYTGGTPFAMPKGWEQVPTDPAQAAGHFMRLLNIYSQQNRGQSDPAQMALEGYKTSEQQLTERQKYGQEVALKNLGFQQAGWLEGLRAQYAQQGREYEYAGKVSLQNMSEANQERINQGNHAFTAWLRQQPDAAMVYNASTKTPQVALDLAMKNASQLPGQLTTAIAGLDKDNTNFKNKNPFFGDPPNPNNAEFGNKLWKMFHQIMQNPAALQQSLDAIKKQQALYDSKAVDKDTGKRLGMSDTQAAMASNWLQKAASNANAVHGAQSAIDVIKQHTFGPGGPGGGGAGAPPPFQAAP